VTANRPMWSFTPEPLGAMKSARQRFGRVTPSTTGRTVCMRSPRQVVSTSLRELQNWDLVKVVHLLGDRRDHYETLQDPWELLRVIVRERKEREFDPTVAFLRDCVGGPGFAKEEAGVQKRLKETLALMETLSSWSEQMLGMENSVLKKLVKLGAKMQSLLKAA